jgi:hypothetical protein
MATLNQVCIPKGKVLDGVVDLTSMEKALELSSVKYNTTLKVDEDAIFIAPQVIADAVAMVNCTITESCALPTVLESDQYTFDAGCSICLTNLTGNERKAFGMSLAKPKPTPAFEAYYERQFINNTLNSTRKINWLGNTAYIAANLANAALLPNYIKENGIWTDLIALAPAAPHVTTVITAKNAQATKLLQTTWTGAEVLQVVDAMLLAQSTTLSMVVDTEKYIWITVEMYQALINEMKNKSFDLCCVGTLASQVSGGVEVPFIQYGDIKIVKYEEFTAAIRDLALVGATWNVPNRAILALGLPNVNYVEQGEFATFYDEVTGSWKASYGLTTAIVDPYPGDFYVLAY